MGPDRAYASGLLDTGPSGPLEWPIIPCPTLDWAVWGLLRPSLARRPILRAWVGLEGLLPWTPLCHLVLPVTNTRGPVTWQEEWSLWFRGASDALKAFLSE